MRWQWNRKSSKQVITSHMMLLCHLLKRAGEVAARSFRPSEEGFIVNTTWRLRITWERRRWSERRRWGGRGGGRRGRERRKRRGRRTYINYMNSTHTAKCSAGLVCLPFSLAELRQRWHVMWCHQQVRQQDDDQCHHSNARRIKDKAYEHTSLSHFDIFIIFPQFFPPLIYWTPLLLTPLNYHITFPPNSSSSLTWLINHLYNSSVESSMSPSFWEPSLHCVISVVYSSPSNNPGTCNNSTQVCQSGHQI